MNPLVLIHNNIFYVFHNFTQYYPELNFLVYSIANIIDVYVVALAVFFVVFHNHYHRKDRTRYLSRQSVREAVLITLGVLSAWAVSFLMKIGFAIARPFIQFSDLIPLFEHGGYNSFPSGHATLFAALAVAIYVHHRRVGSIFIFFAFIIGITRVMSGVHFPLDVLAGWILGTVCSLVVYTYLLRKPLS